MTEDKFLVSENMIMWAFRYALGRRTGAVEDVVICLKRVWKYLTEFTQEQIRQEITEALIYNQAGDQCDIDSWQEILDYE